MTQNRMNENKISSHWLSMLTVINIQITIDNRFSNTNIKV